MEKMLDGKNCIVTGAGRGIGKATALLFAGEGGKIVVAELDADVANETVEEIKKMGGKAVPFIGDICADGAAEELVQTAVGAFGPSIDVIVNVAGFTWDALIHKMTDEQWDAIMNIHLKAPFRIIRAAAPYIRDVAKKEMESGRRVMRKIINVSSMAGALGNPGQPNYSAAKAGIIGLTMSLSKEWGRFNVNVNAVAFGFVETRMTQEKEKGDFVIAPDGTKMPVGIPKVGRDAFIGMIPLGRPATPEEAARPILFFASPLSDYVSGEVLKVSGGWI